MAATEPHPRSSVSMNGVCMRVALHALTTGTGYEVHAARPRAGEPAHGSPRTVALHRLAACTFYHIARLDGRTVGLC